MADIPVVVTVANNAGQTSANAIITVTSSSATNYTAEDGTTVYTTTGLVAYTTET